MCARAADGTEFVRATEGTELGIGAREKYSASPARLVTTLTTLGLWNSSASRRGRLAVLISSDESASIGAIAASIVSGSINGSSPCRLTTARQGWAATTSAMRSVPLTWSARVITAAPPKACTALAMRSSSVATSTACTRRDRDARRYTCSIIGRPAILARIFPGRRVDWNLAGMTARTDDSVSVKGRRSTELGCTTNHTTVKLLELL